MSATIPLAPIIIGSWADECEEDDYASDACQNVEHAKCQTGVSTAQIMELKEVTAANLIDFSKAEEGGTEDGYMSPCCVLSPQASASASRSSSTPRSQMEPSSAKTASLTSHLQGSPAQPTTALERLQEAMRKHGFARTPSECAAAAQVNISTFASMDCRLSEKPMDKAPIREAARLLQHAHDAQKEVFPRRRPERGASAHNFGARCAVPCQSTTELPCSTITNGPLRGANFGTAKPRQPGMPDGLRMLQQSVHASAAQRGCTPSRLKRPARQQQQLDKLASALSAKAAQAQDMPPLPCAADPAQPHEQFAAAPSGDLMQQAAKPSFPVAAEPAEQLEESSSPSSSEATSCMPAPLQFGTLAWDCSKHCAMGGQPIEPEKQPQAHKQPSTQGTAAGMTICFGSFTEQDAVDLQLLKAATQPTQQLISPTAGNISVEAAPQSNSGSATQQGELADKSTPVVMLDSVPTDQLTWPYALPLQACSLAEACSRWMLPTIMQSPIKMAVDATINVLAATCAAIDFYKGQQH